MTQPGTGDIDQTKDTQWSYTITTKDAARFGGNKPSDFIFNNFCTNKNTAVKIDNGRGGFLTATFSGNSTYAQGIVQVAKDWEGWRSDWRGGPQAGGSWFLYHDIIIYKSKEDKTEMARLEIDGEVEDFVADFMASEKE